MLLLLAFLDIAFAQLRSVPIPLYMDQMLSAGRQVYDKQSTPTQNLGLFLWLESAHSLPRHAHKREIGHVH